MPKERFYSPDVLRGLAIMIMLFVDAPPAAIAYPIFIHAPWQGLTFADFAFPGFVFAMGMSAAISASRHEPSTRKILRRTIALFIIGILFNTLPVVLMYMLWPDFTAADFFDAAIVHGRPLGILQRLALTYALGIFIMRTVKSNVGILIAAFVLLLTSSAGFHIYAPDNPFAQSHNLGGAIDMLIPGANHIYTPTHDPEGLYGTIASTASFLFGVLAGKVLLDTMATTRDKIFLLTISAVALLIIGEVWSAFDIVAKNLWTAPFALITSAVEILLFAALTYLFDRFPRSKKFFHPLAAAGMNPLFLFLFIGAAFMLLNILPTSDGSGVYIWFFMHTFSLIVSPEFGSMIFCGLWCLMWLPLAELLYRCKIVIKL